MIIKIKAETLYSVISLVKTAMFLTWAHIEMILITTLLLFQGIVEFVSELNTQFLTTVSLVIQSCSDMFIRRQTARYM